MKSFRLLSIILIACLGILVYSNTFFCSFHFDDFRFIADNGAIRNIRDLHSIWHFFHGRFVTFLSFALNYQFNGLDVFGYHLINLAVHLVSAILVWWLTLLTLSTPAMKGNKITQDANLIALLTGLVFVSHPVQIEAVTNIWQRAASMMALFYLASLCLYVKSRLLQINKQSPGLYYAGSLITAVVAMFTKENAITLPLMALLYEVTFFNARKSFDWKYILTFVSTIFIIPVTFLFIKSQAFQQMHGDLSVNTSIITPAHYLLTQFRVMVTYIRLAFLPFHQNLDYDYPVFKNILELPVLLSFLFLIAILYWAKRLFSTYRLVSFSICWFFLTITIPESSFWVMGDVISEHRLYLPLVGFSIFLVSSVYYFLGRNYVKWAVITLIVMITGYSFLTYQRNKVWKDEFSLWEDVLEKSPHKARAYNSLGTACIRQGNYTEAMVDFNKAVAINPDFAQALSNRGASYLQEGNFTQALDDYNKAIENDPDNTRAYYGRATTYCYLKEYDKAWEDVDRVKEIGSPIDYELIYKLVKKLAGS